MVKEAESHADEDKKRREEAEIKNNADNLVYSTEKTLKDLGDKVTDEDRKGIEESINETKEALKGTDLEKIKESSEKLSQGAHKLSELVYQQAQADQANAAGKEEGATESGGEAEAEPDEGEVIDAEVVDEEQK